MNQDTPSAEFNFSRRSLTRSPSFRRGDPLTTQGMGWDVFVDVSPKGPDALFRRALDSPCTDKGIHAFRLKVNRASGQSVVRRHTRARAVTDIIVVGVGLFLVLRILYLL